LCHIYELVSGGRLLPSGCLLCVESPLENACRGDASAPALPVGTVLDCAEFATACWRQLFSSL
jgi:hypothetical protein